MKYRLLGLALLCGASIGARADVERDRIAAERAAVNASRAERERECSTRFVVAACVDEARADNRTALAGLRQRELQLDQLARHTAADARRKAIAEKAEAQQARAGEASPEPPRVRFRQAPEPPSPPAARESRDGVPLPPGGDEPGQDRATIEQRNQQKFDARQREAAAHREAVMQRNSEHAAKGRPTAPLPVPAR
jgi:colicin import membrane protein